MHLLTEPTAQPKAEKGLDHGWATFVLHLAPADSSGYNTCPMSTPGCRESCLNTAGRGAMDVVQRARIRRTKLFFEDRAEFMRLLVADIEAAQRWAARRDKSLAIRLNGTSDIRWENAEVYAYGRKWDNVMDMFPMVEFYDYTKIPNRRNLPENYHLTFSRSEFGGVSRAMRQGTNVAVVFDTPKGAPLPETFLGWPVFDGRTHDIRHLDPSGHIIGLSALGKAKHDTSGFVVRGG